MTLHAGRRIELLSGHSIKLWVSGKTDREKHTRHYAHPKGSVNFTYVESANS
jgi:hypothetical protein